MSKISLAEINSIRLKEQGSNPSSPAATYGQLFIKSDGVYFINAAGAVVGPLAAAVGGGYTQGARVNLAADITTWTSGSVYLPAFGSENFDTDTIHDNSTNPTRLTCKTAGKYMIYGSISSDILASFSVGIFLNGSITIANANYPSQNGHIMTVWDMAQNDYVEMRLFQATGSNRTIWNSTSEHTHFGMQRVG